jgi:putative endonuclease
MDKKQLGVLGERIAENYLKKKGYKILEKNYIERLISGPVRGEIDIIAQKSSIINFVEVKTLAKDDGGRFSIISPEDKVNFQKQKKIIETAERWLMEKKIPLDTKWQIDVIGIEINLPLKKAKIRHFPNAIF